MASMDIFGRTAERRMERRLVAEYFATVADLIAGLTPENLELTTAIASIPEHIRGYGHIKEASVATAEARAAELMTTFRSALVQQEAAE